VKNVDVHLAEGKVDVEFDPNEVTLDKVKEAIEDQGYEVA
jgi:copper chaperone